MCALRREAHSTYLAADLWGVKQTRKPAAKKSTRKRSIGVKTKARRPKAAALAATGATTAAIAQELGVSRVQAWRILRAEEVQQLVVSMVNSHAEVLFSTFEKAIVTIGEALAADRPDVITKEGAIIPGGPDHYARLAAVQRLLQVLTAGRPKPKPADPGERKGMTLDQLEAALKDPRQ